jgi:hypothetical protein
MSCTEYITEFILIDGQRYPICVPKRSDITPKKGGGVSQEAKDKQKQQQRDERKQQKQQAATARQRPGGRATTCTVTEPAPPVSKAPRAPINLRWVAAAVAAIFVVTVVTTYAAAIATALTYLLLAAVVLGGLRLLWSLRDALPEINWSYIHTWLDHRRQINHKRAQWLARVEEDKQPIALPPPRPSHMHDTLMQGWVHGPSHWDEREHQKR